MTDPEQPVEEQQAEDTVAAPQDPPATEEVGEKDENTDGDNAAPAAPEAPEEEEEGVKEADGAAKDTEANDGRDESKPEETEAESKSEEANATAEEKPDSSAVETPTPKRRRGRPPKKTPQSGDASTTPASKTPSSARSSSKRKTPESAASNLSSLSSTKRQRKAASTFEPANFKAERLAAQELKQCPKGRGVQLLSLDKVKASINKNKEDPILAALYKFIFSTMHLTGKGKTSTNKMKSTLLEFSGFMLPDEEENGEKMDVDGEGEKEKGEEDDEEAKTKQTVEEKNAELKEKFESKAAELTDALLKSFLNILVIERPARLSKEEKINKLLAFLAEPSESLLATVSQTEKVEEVIAQSSEVRKRGPGRPRKSDSSTPTVKKGRGRGRPKKKKSEEADVHDDLETKDVDEEQEEESNDDDNDEILDGQTIPSAKKLRKWVKAYVTCFDLDKCNAKHAIQTASDKFKVDLTAKKNTLMEMLKDEISA